MTKDKTEYCIKIPKASFWSLIGGLATLIAVFYITTKLDIERLKTRIDYQDSQQQTTEKSNEKVNEKLDFIITKIAGIEATMKYKEDKKGASSY